MKLLFKIFFVALLAFSLCGLSSRFGIKVLQQNSATLCFKFGDTGPSKSSGVKINTFLVVKKGDSGQWDYKSPVWAFELTPGSAKPLSRVTYGQVPAGFAETTKASPLTEGTHYLAVGLSPGSGGSAEFVAH